MLKLPRGTFMATVTAPPPLLDKKHVQQVRVPLPGASERLISLDAFRGLTMLLLISHGFGIYAAFKSLCPLLADQFEHAKWVGCTLWDLIQPAFTFIVGAAMPLSMSRRLEQGSSRSALFRHVLWRAFILISLSNILSNWNGNKPPVLQLINVLCQIAFGYIICFAIM